MSARSEDLLPGRSLLNLSEPLFASLSYLSTSWFFVLESPDRRPVQSVGDLRCP